MGEPLSSEQVAEIRAQCEPQQTDEGPLTPMFHAPKVLALCDTAEALRAEDRPYGKLAFDRLKDQAFRDMAELARERDEAQMEFADALRELETLRDIARRVRDGWVTSWSNGDWLPEGWYWLHDRRLDSVRLTEAEVRAIYGRQEEESDGG